jgi:hypothetical protein
MLVVSAVPMNYTPGKLRRVMNLRSFGNTIVILSLLAAAIASPCAADQVVATIAELKDAISAANSGTGDLTILLADGTYVIDVAWGLGLSADGITVRGQNGNRDAVVIQGTGMTGGPTHGFQVRADHVTIADLTIRLVCNHAIQIHGESPHDADDVVLRNLVIQDTGEQMVKASYRDGEAAFGSDRGLVENCWFEYTAGVGPQWYIGGVDVHHGKDWVVRGNTFRNIRSPGPSVAEHAVHFWTDSQNTLVEGNVIVNCDRGIGFGLGSRGHINGVIVNNMIYHGITGGFSDVGIELENATGSFVCNNSIVQEHAYPAAISYRFSGSSGITIANNLIHLAGSNPIWSRDGGSATLIANVTNASPDWFRNPAAGDLHLRDIPLPTVIDQGSPVCGVTHDFDGDVRPQGDGIDIGADERYGTSLKGSSWGALKAIYR